MTTTADHFPPEYFAKQDPSDDDLFYEYPRMVAHIDSSAVAFLRDEVYTHVLPQGGVYLDLMSSRYSHLPDSLQPEKVYAHGMNAPEMAANPQVDEYITQNLNRNQTLPFEDVMFDAAMCCVSVQYLEKPVEVFTDVLRTLKSGAPFVVSFSNRCFPTKAMRLWLSTSDEQHVELVQQYMQLAGFARTDTRIKKGGMFGIGGDPLYAVIGYKA